VRDYRSGDDRSKDRPDHEQCGCGQKAEVAPDRWQHGWARLCRYVRNRGAQIEGSDRVERHFLAIPTAKALFKEFVAHRGSSSLSAAAMAAWSRFKA
jgi:hypothetical protein